MDNDIPDDMTREEYRMTLPEPKTVKEQIVNNHEPVIPREPKPSAVPQPKVIAATVGAGVGAAVSTVAIYLIELFTKVDVPAEVEGASVVIISALLAFGSGYYKKN